jgi:hypothetical protein
MQEPPGPTCPTCGYAGFAQEQDCPACTGRKQRVSWLRSRLDEAPTARILVTTDPWQQIRVEMDTIRPCGWSCDNCGDEHTAPHCWIQVQPGAYREIHLCSLCEGHAVEILGPAAIVRPESLVEQLLNTALERERAKPEPEVQTTFGDFGETQPR